MQNSTKWVLGLGTAAVAALVFLRSDDAQAATQPKLPGKIVHMNTDLVPQYSKQAGTWYTILYISYSDGSHAQQIVPILQNDGATHPTPDQVKAANNKMMDALLRLGMAGKEPTVVAVSPMYVTKDSMGVEHIEPAQSPRSLAGIKTLPDGTQLTVYSMVLSNGVQWYFGVLLLPEGNTPPARLGQLETLQSSLVGKNASDAEKVLLNAPDIFM